jgi:beta-glucosidase
MALTRLTFFACALLLGPAVGAQTGLPQETPFSYVQPLNTTILGQYGHSPAVYPSRMCGLHTMTPVLR